MRFLRFSSCRFNRSTLSFASTSFRLSSWCLTFRATDNPSFFFSISSSFFSISIICFSFLSSNSRSCSSFRRCISLHFSFHFDHLLLFLELQFKIVFLLPALHLLAFLLPFLALCCVLEGLLHFERLESLLLEHLIRNVIRLLG